MPTIVGILTFMSRINLCSAEFRMEKVYNLRSRIESLAACYVFCHLLKSFTNRHPTKCSAFILNSAGNLKQNVFEKIDK